MTTLIAQMSQEELTEMIETLVERKFMALLNEVVTELEPTIPVPLSNLNDNQHLKQKKVLQGYFWQVNFQAANRCVKLHLSNNRYVKCTFDETLAAKVQEAMQHDVRVWGLATIEPTTDEIRELELKGVTILDVPPEIEAIAKTFDEAKSYILAKNFELHRRLAQ